MINLSDTQRIILSTASQRVSYSALPLPPSLKPSGGTSKAIAALLKRGLLEEQQTNEADGVHRTDGDTRIGLYLTATGAAAIGVELAPASASARATSTKAAPDKRPSKAAAVVGLLARPGGATMPELIAATGWLPHTTRAALTGLRKKGHAVTRDRRDGVTCYRIAGQA